MLSSLVRNGIAFGTVEVQKDTCNTALAVSGSRVLALMEQSPPSEIAFARDGRMRTVESMCRLNGAVPFAPINGGSLGAHGRTDPRTGERVHVSYNSVSRPFVRVDTFDDGWELKSTVGVDVPAPVMVHDCALTENYAVILDFPLTIRPRRFIRNAFPVEYEPQNGARIGLTPRGRNDNDKDGTIWIDVESGVVLHAANAYENREDGTVVVHAFKSIPSGESSYILDYTPSFLYEWVLDPKSGKVVEERCLNPDVLVEFPQIAEKDEGEKAKYAYGLVSTSIGGPMLQFKTPQVGVLLDSVVKFSLLDDADTGVAAGDVASRFDLPSGWHSVSEPTIVTKTGGDGHYVLLVATFVPPSADENGESDHVKIATDGKSMRSQLLVLDGDCLSDGPVTTVDLPYHVNYGLHSMFLDYDKMMVKPR
jgi:carotenoid cleavage dioxygenase